MRRSTAHAAPSARQLSHLKELAERTGTSFAYPRTRAQASAEIARLRSLQDSQAHCEGRDHDEPSYATDPPPPGRRARAAGSNARGSELARATPGRRRPARRLGGYSAARTGEAREVVAVPGACGTMLVIDRLAADQADPRLVAHLAADEPPENARIVSRMYLADPTRGRCRQLGAADLELDPPASSTSAPEASTHGDSPLCDADGRVYRIREVSQDGSLAELRWTRSQERSETFEALTLRDVVGALEDYEPARTITLQALRRHHDDYRVSSCRLRDELERVNASAIVLNRGLREALERKLAGGALTMSEIARRCGRFKRDGDGSGAADTSWLARRVGLLPEGGDDAPTVWIHSDVLARIARDGLDVGPNEVELG